MTEFTPMEEMLKIQSESLGLQCEKEGKTIEELLNLHCEKYGLHFDLDDLRRKMAYAQPPKCPEQAVLFLPTYPPTQEDEAALKLELHKYSLANGYTSPEPHDITRSYTSVKYSDARNLLIKRKLTERKRFGVQWIVTYYNNCLNREETEVLIHDEDGEHVEVLFHKVCDLYDYGVCVSNTNGWGYKCSCKNKKPASNVCVPEDTTEYRAIIIDDLFKFMA